MQSNKNDEIFNWKKLSDGAFITQFPSFLSNQKIYLKKIETDVKTKKSLTIFLFHDVASHHGRFYRLINWFNSHYSDVNFVMMDFLGHGLSSGTRGHIDNFSHLVNDISLVFRTMEKKTDETWIALGQGVGALALLDLANRFDKTIQSRIDKLILSNFILNFSNPILNIQNNLINKIISLEAMMKMTRPLEIYLPKFVLTHSKAQRVYMEDSLIVRKPTLQTFKCIQLKLESVFQDSYFIDKPTLILQTESPYLLPQGMDSFSKGLKKDLFTEKKYSNLKHDLYNEKDNNIVFKDIADWIQL